jgi:hypothetical protein
VLSLRAVEVWEPTRTLWGQSNRKSLIQVQVLRGGPRFVRLNTSLSGSIVLNAELESTRLRGARFQEQGKQWVAFFMYNPTSEAFPS